MKAIILAAGSGTRLMPLTENIPKCMVNLFGKSILERQIKVFKECGINEIILVTGYMSNKIPNFKIKQIRNLEYNDTNMVESLFCAENVLNDTTIVCYGDIVFEKQVLKKLIEATDYFSLIIDKKWEKIWKLRFNDPLSDAETLSVDKNAVINDIGQKTNNIKSIMGQYTGLMKFDLSALKIIKEFYHKSKKLAATGTNPLNEKIPFKKSFMTDFLRGLINDGVKMKAIFIENGWLEVDSIEDLKKYEQLYKEGKIFEIFNPNK